MSGKSERQKFFDGRDGLLKISACVVTALSFPALLVLIVTHTAAKVHGVMGDSSANPPSSSANKIRASDNHPLPGVSAIPTASACPTGTNTTTTNSAPNCF